MTPSLAVIVPMYNEERGARRCVEAIVGAIRRDTPSGVRLIVVNDGSRDGTGKELRRLHREGWEFDLVTHEKNRGYGAALVSGSRRADELGFDFVLFMDSDLTNDPAMIAEFAKQIVAAEDEVDVFKASRFIPGGGMRGVPWRRQIVSVLGNRVAARLFRIGVRDCTNGFRCVRTSLLRGLELHERGFAIILEELYWLKVRGARFRELPYVLTSRAAEEKPSSFSYNWPTISAYWRYAWKSAFVTAPERA